ncbi:MAG: 50S ribosomal protein L9 [Candidatus Dadabacteria bacterium]|nr:50S ribosomal protein L9 [Candidatus Dadabacteria bacterium]
MRVILTTDVESVGKMGEIKEVKNGLARNYLIPKKLAIRATPGNMKVWEQKSNIIMKREEGLKVEAQGYASKIDGVSVSIAVKVGEGNKIFGSVTSQNISAALKEAGFEVSRKDIKLESPIKVLGTHDVSVKLYQDVEANISVTVIGENGEVAEPEVVQTEAETTEEIPEEAAAETEADSQPEEIEEIASENTEEIPEEEAAETETDAEPEELEEEKEAAEETKEEES